MRITAATERDPEAAELVAAVLEDVAAALEQRSLAGQLPIGERATWESVGAVFDDTDAVARTRARAATAFADLLARSLAGDRAVAERLGVDRSRISQRVAEGSLYAVARGDDRYYPDWQFDGGSVLRGLKVVLTPLDPAAHPLTVDRWFTAPNLELEADGEPLSPVEWLRTGGDPTLVAALAADL